MGASSLLSGTHLLRLRHQLCELFGGNGEMENFGDMIGP